MYKIVKLMKGCHFTWKKLLAPNLGLGIDLTKQGRWAVITGATDGIGKAFAMALASKGLDIVLISRSLIKLKDVENEIKEKYGVKTRIVVADLTEGQIVYSKILKATEELEIGILINNAGINSDYPEVFIKTKEEMLNKILQLNVVSLTNITRLILPGMMERKKGIIINISSIAGMNISCPYLTTYAATKAYIIKFSANLAAEVIRNGIIVQCIAPGPIVTKMTKIRKSTWMIPTTDKFVESALKTVGIELLTTGYLSHYFILGCIKILTYVSEKNTTRLIGRTLRENKKRFLRIMMKEQK
ncbi:very-long-chain 3-oxoacyl-CoA reductase-like isoform X2 [Vespa velutina]|uniref:very-long-chain 3-oxoacyl-CoA reductase-like isoform X2 n=1 Tax=Vespa velutina TaxID=202808 RepID=UPI001FB21DB9|nr:very-long-chain 3-oxoacyl-CoA reductase-like isoform X2 [Vespa velutina]